MTETEIKKSLYKQKPIAVFNYIQNGNAYYSCEINEGEVEFEIPVSDMGEAAFLSDMEAFLLNRWIKNFK